MIESVNNRDNMKHANRLLKKLQNPLCNFNCDKTTIIGKRIDNNWSLDSNQEVENVQRNLID